MAYLNTVIPNGVRAVRNLLFLLRRAPKNFPPPNTPKPSQPSLLANPLPSTSPPKSASSIVSSRSQPRAPSNPRTTSPMAASPSPSPNPASPPPATNPARVIPNGVRGERNLLFLLSALPSHSTNPSPPNTPSSPNAALAVSFPSPPQTLPPFSQLRDNIMWARANSAKSLGTARSASNLKGTQPSIPPSMSCAMSGPILSNARWSHDDAEAPLPR